MTESKNYLTVTQDEAGWKVNAVAEHGGMALLMLFMAARSLLGTAKANNDPAAIMLLTDVLNEFDSHDFPAPSPVEKQ